MKDILFVRNHYSVTIKSHSFKLKNYITKEEHYYPCSEVDYIVFDNAGCFLSEAAFRGSVNNDVCLLFLDYKHSPILAVESIYGQSKRANLVENQLAMSSRVKRTLWKKIVIEKVKNQALTLDTYGAILSSNQLMKLAESIDLGDSKNIEGTAARIYFPNLFGSAFKRGRYNDVINSSLNYGYAIVRMAIRRELVMHGLDPSFGIHHKSDNNPFNLSDDLIEPFRPIVDAWIKEKLGEFTELNIDFKKEIVHVLMSQCLLDDKIYTVSDAIRVSVASFVTCVNENRVSSLLLPRMIELGR